MSRFFRRGLATIPPTPAGPSSAAARTVPLDVARRRAEFPKAQRFSPLNDPEQFVASGELPEQLEYIFQKMRTAGQYKGDETSARRAFLKSHSQWRSRVRGYGMKRTQPILDAEGKPLRDANGKIVMEVKTIPDTLSKHHVREGREREPMQGMKDGWTDTVMGQKIYLPNIEIRLMRNHTKVGEAYDPWVATFRMPLSMAKNDIRSYLSAVYGLDVTFIRTAIYYGEFTRKITGRVVRQSGIEHNYKRVIVGLTEPFHYPDDIEEMRAGTWGGHALGKEQAAAREAVLEAEYLVKGAKEHHNKAIRKYREWKDQSSLTTLQEIMRRRATREGSINAVAVPRYQAMVEQKAAQSAAPAEPQPSA